MKRIMVASTLMAAALVVCTGVAWAATVNCQVGVPCVGTDEADELIGTDTPDEMNAKQRSDRLYGFRGGDRMIGDDEPRSFGERLSNDGDDELFGNRGPDILEGYGGDDLLRGGRGRDQISALDLEQFTLNPGEDTVMADGGSDRINAFDSFPDTIKCGDDFDLVRFDKGLDKVAADCEERIFDTSAASSGRTSQNSSSTH